MNKTYKGVFLIIISSLLVSVGQLFWKLSRGRVNLWILSGFILHFLGALIMITAFRYGDLSILHPMLSINYFIALILGSIFLKEPITSFKIVGTAIIFLGVVLLVSENN